MIRRTAQVWSAKKQSLGAVAAAGLAAFAAACSAGQSRPASAGADTILIGRVLASRDVVWFIGDVANEGYVHVVEPRDTPGTRRIVFTGTSECPAPGDKDRLYKMSVGERRILYGITDEESRKWTPSLAILSCAPVE